MNSKFILGTSLAAVLLAGAPLMALADEGGAQVNAGFNVGSFIGQHLSLTAQAGIHADSDADDNGKVGGDASSTIKIGDERGGKHMGRIGSSTQGSVAAGTVTAVNGSGFTLADFLGGLTTTVVTDANTVFKAKGGATTSAAVTTGTRVVVLGTTTATSTSGNTVVASLVRIIGEGFGHLGAWFHFHNR